MISSRLSLFTRMGFEDFVVSFMESHINNFVFLIVDENLDYQAQGKQMTISGSQCVENIRRRLPGRLERRMFALIRSANDSSSDVAIYSSRAHGFLPKAPIKRDKVHETLAPLWLSRFPPSVFGETIGLRSINETAASNEIDVASSPDDIAQKLEHIESLFEDSVHTTNLPVILEQMHELKGDLLTLETSMSVMNVIANVNLILVTRAPDMLFERWQACKVQISDIVSATKLSLEEKFRIPANTYCIAIDDSNIQRKLLGKFFEFMGVPKQNCTILGEQSDEIIAFEDIVCTFMEEHEEDYGEPILVTYFS